MLHGFWRVRLIETIAWHVAGAALVVVVVGPTIFCCQHVEPKSSKFFTNALATDPATRSK